MKVLKFSFLFYSIFLCLGIFVADHISFHIAGVLLFISLLYIGFTSLSICKVRSSSLVTMINGVAISCLFFSLGIFCEHLRVYKSQEKTLSLSSLDIQHKPVSFVVEQHLPSANSNYKRYIARVIKQDSISQHKRVLIYFQGDSKDLEIGHVYYTKAKLQSVPSPKHKNGFDFKRYMYITYQVEEQTYVSDVIYLGKSLRWLDKMKSLRDSAIARIAVNESLSRDSKSFVLALVFGDRSLIESDIKEQFNMLGIMHILAISGLHIGIIYFLLAAVFSFLSKKWRFVLITFILWCFVFISGFSPPVYRAVLMFSVVSLSIVLRRDNKLEYSIGIALILSLIFEPLLLYNVSFQLSYIAVLSIVFLLPIFRKFRSKYKVLNYFLDIVFVSFVVQVGLLPLQLFYFQQFTFAFFIGNLFAIPAITLILFLAILVVVSILFIGEMYFFLDAVFNLSIKVFLGLVKKLQLIDFLVLKEINISSLTIFLYFGFVVLLYLSWKLRNKWLLSLLLIWCNLSVYIHIFERNNALKDFLLVPYQSKSEIPKITVYQHSKLIHQFEISDSTSIRVIPYLNWKVLVLHEYSPYYLNDIPYDYLIVCGNVKVNYDRLFSVCSFKEVVIDGRTSTWLKDMIKKSCLKHNIPFHDVYEKGYWEL